MVCTYSGQAYHWLGGLAAADQLAVGAGAAQHAPAVAHDLAQQGLADGVQVDQVHWAPGARGQGMDQGHFLLSAQLVVGVKAKGSVLGGAQK